MKRGFTKTQFYVVSMLLSLLILVILVYAYGGSDPAVHGHDSGEIESLRMATGTYTGNGAASRAITGVGFQPKYVKVWQRPTNSEGNIPIGEKMDGSWGVNAAIHSTSGAHVARSNRIISLDSDGFTVGDNNVDGFPNTNGATYDWMALG